MSRRILDLLDRVEKLVLALEESKTHEYESLSKDIEAVHRKVVASLDEESSRLEAFD